MNKSEATECYAIIKGAVNKTVPYSLIDELTSAFEEINVAYVKKAITLFFKDNGYDFYPSAKSLRKSLYDLKRIAEINILTSVSNNLYNDCHWDQIRSGEVEQLPVVDMPPWIEVVNDIGMFFKKTASAEERDSL